jgi:hypothetical protein
MTTLLDNQELDKQLEEIFFRAAGGISDMANEEVLQVKLIILQQAHRIGNLAIGEDEDIPYDADIQVKLHIEAHNCEKQEQRQKLAELTGFKGGE